MGYSVREVRRRLRDLDLDEEFLKYMQETHPAEEPGMGSYIAQLAFDFRVAKEKGMNLDTYYEERHCFNVVARQAWELGGGQEGARVRLEFAEEFIAKMKGEGDAT